VGNVNSNGEADMILFATNFKKKRAGANGRSVNASNEFQSTRLLPVA